MTIYLVDIEQVMHSCPAHTETHPFDIRRTLVDVTPGGPCRAPVTIRCGDTVTQIPCHRHEPAKRQCGACRVIVTERTITTRTLATEVAA
ncbi:hypothetical protein EV384_0363 [Micromonospora kangleipakensis]|uniref:Uncharacterized protein n=1 Tax=Micromonospora kangleipakensis TaxID=1077942 RepID=A0A4Q8B3E2_9ACTN|nr:hypothetical protein [Micromonospora kangleipakensis]RZU72024.1 hypothetical protein EV384_0363 [Micromonospora kangleipakensis]